MRQILHIIVFLVILILLSRLSKILGIPIMTTDVTQLATKCSKNSGITLCHNVLENIIGVLMLACQTNTMITLGKKVTSLTTLYIN